MFIVGSYFEKNMKVYQNLCYINEQVADPITMIKHQIKGRVYTIPQSLSDAETIKRIWVNGTEVLPEMGSGLRPFYECGFDWGKEAGNRSYTTALSICLSVFREERLAENLFVCFREEFVQYFPSGDFDLLIDISVFLQKYQSRIRPNLYSFFCFSSLINSREILVYKDQFSAELSVDLSENYAMHNLMIADQRLRQLNERKQKLMFRFFSKDSYIVKGYDLHEVMRKVEDIMSKLYWKSLEKVMRNQYRERIQQKKTS
jgi:hypothetical protein